MKVSQELSISIIPPVRELLCFGLSSIGSETVSPWITGVEPVGFNNKAAEVARESMDAIEINNIFCMLGENKYGIINLLKAQGRNYCPTMLKNTYQGVNIEKRS